MSYLARQLLAVIADAERIVEHNPTLAALGRRQERDCRWLVSRAEMRRKRQIVVGGRAERDDVERVGAEWPDWEDQHADRRRRHWEEKEQPRQREARYTRLRRLTLRELVAEALAPAVDSTVRAGNIEPSPGGTDGPAGPPRQQLPDDDPRVRLAEQHLRRAAEQLIRLRWEEHGWESSTPTMLGEHKNDEILKCEGARPRDVVAVLGTQIAGSTRTVERVREEDDRCRWCGQTWPH